MSNGLLCLEDLAFRAINLTFKLSSNHFILVLTACLVVILLIEAKYQLTLNFFLWPTDLLASIYPSSRTIIYFS
jgi:hypothetical protein